MQFTQEGFDVNNTTPWHLWLIGGLTVLWNGFGAVDFTGTVTHFEPYMGNFPQEMMDYWYSMPMWMFALWGVGTWGGFLGSALLLLRKKMAVIFFGASLIAVVISTIAGLVNPPPADMQNSGLTFFILAVAAGLLFYAMRMQKAGVLR